MYQHISIAKHFHHRSESAVLHRMEITTAHVKSTYRLIRSYDAERNEEIFSVFLTTETKNMVDEEFLFDISREETIARHFFTLLCQSHVTACTLRDTAENYLSIQ